jgi:hypothetical protein
MGLNRVRKRQSPNRSISAFLTFIGKQGLDIVVLVLADVVLELLAIGTAYLLRLLSVTVAQWKCKHAQRWQRKLRTLFRYAVLVGQQWQKASDALFDLFLLLGIHRIDRIVCCEYVGAYCATIRFAKALVVIRFDYLRIKHGHEILIVVVHVTVGQIVRVLLMACRFPVFVCIAYGRVDNIQQSLTGHITMLVVRIARIGARVQWFKLAKNKTTKTEIN